MNAAHELRLAIRQGRYRGLTTGLARGHVQANLVVLPSEHLQDLLSFCAGNHAACPVLGVSLPGVPAIPSLAEDMDLRTDLPGYFIHRRGQAPQPVDDLAAAWRDDLVAVAIGCWFSMEDALLAAGVRLRHLEMGIQGPLYRTSLRTRRVGIFGGGSMVVSMRPFARDAVDTVRRVTGGFPRVHGAPLHEGDPAALGIADLLAPDFGEPMEPLPDEVALYWGCGLTVQVALADAGIASFLTHAPGKMLVTDRLNAELALPPVIFTQPKVLQ